MAEISKGIYSTHERKEMMDNRQIIGKLRDCAKGLLDVARELQRTERVESPRTLEIVKRQVKARVGKAHKYDLPFVVGVDDFGNDVVLELARLPHVLVGGAAGQGKSMCLNSLIAGLISTKTPTEVRFLVFDPKCVEYTGLADLPHLLMPPVTAVQKMVQIARWLESEVNKRLRMFASARCRNIAAFNSRKHIGDNADELPKTVPYIVAVFDEFADLMMTQGKEVEVLVSRITAKARAAGIHIVIATSRPDCKVVTGLLKSNLPGRLVFKTVSGIDSRTVIDDVGAENLYGRGDFLFRSGFDELVRGQGAYISDAELDELVSAAVEKYGSPKYAEDEK